MGKELGKQRDLITSVFFPAKPLPWFISNWKEGPSVAQPGEDAGSLWEKRV